MVHISTFTDVFQNRHASSFFKRKADLPKHLEDMLTERKLPLTSLIFKILICGIRRGSIITSISFTIILSIYSKIRFCKINWGVGEKWLVLHTLAACLQNTDECMESALSCPYCSTTCNYRCMYTTLLVKSFPGGEISGPYSAVCRVNYPRTSA